MYMCIYKDIDHLFLICLVSKRISQHMLQMCSSNRGIGTMSFVWQNRICRRSLSSPLLWELHGAPSSALFARRGIRECTVLFHQIKVASFRELSNLFNLEWRELTSCRIKFSACLASGFYISYMQDFFLLWLILVKKFFHSNFIF